MNESAPKPVPREGTLRLTPEQRFGNWTTWTQSVQKSMRSGELEKAAHMLACCMVGPDTPKEKIEEARTMFTLPELVPYHQQLWDFIVQDNEPVYDDGVKTIRETWPDREEIANFLFDEFGWKLE